MNYSDLAAVLETATDKKSGMIVPDDASEAAGSLDAQLKALAVTGPAATPELLPTAEDRLAYWYNARAAWALKVAMLREFPEKMPAAELEDRPFRLDGRSLTLKRIDAILAEAGGWQALVAAPGVLLQRAGLPRKPFAPADVRRRIARRLSEFVDDERRFVIEIVRKRILIPPVIWQVRHEVLQSHREDTGAEEATFTTALLPHVRGSAHRRLQDAIGYGRLPARPRRDLAVAKD